MHFSRQNFYLILPLLATAIAIAPYTTHAFEYKTTTLTEQQAEEYKLDTSFYKKCTQVKGILIATSDKVPDTTHHETAYQFDMIMKCCRPDIAQRITERKVLCLIVGHAEMTSDLPQFTSDKTGDELAFYNWRNRGFLCSKNGRPTVLFAEEDVMEYEGGMRIESILLHEFAHVIHGVGFDKDLQERLTATYKKSIDAGRWNDGYAAQRFRRVKGDKPVRLLDAIVKAFPDESSELIKKCLDEGDVLVNDKPTCSKVKVTESDKVRIVFGGEKQCYAGKNRAEFWAEGLQCWFDTNRTMDHDHNHIHTREQLVDYDPDLTALIKDVVLESPWRFVSPRDRVGTDHLTDYNLETAPVVVSPDFIKDAANDYYDRYWKSYWQRLYDKHGIERPGQESAE